MAKDRGWMWDEAFEMLERADRLHRQFFAPAPAGGGTWQPPVDVFENEAEICIVVALPGVAPEQTEIAIEAGALVVRGVRRLSPEARDAIRRLEIPHGRFERRVALAAGRYEIGRRAFKDGCLILGLRKL
jgi:HSP20 family molecular chaperone IbpA